MASENRFMEELTIQQTDPKDIVGANFWIKTQTTLKTTKNKKQKKNNNVKKAAFNKKKKRNIANSLPGVRTVEI